MSAEAAAEAGPLEWVPPAEVVVTTSPYLRQRDFGACKAFLVAPSGARPEAGGHSGHPRQSPTLLPPVSTSSPPHCSGSGAGAGAGAGGGTGAGAGAAP